MTTLPPCCMLKPSILASHPFWVSSGQSAKNKKVCKRVSFVLQFGSAWLQTCNCSRPLCNSALLPLNAHLRQISRCTCSIMCGAAITALALTQASSALKHREHEANTYLSPQLQQQTHQSYKHASHVADLTGRRGAEAGCSRHGDVCTVPVHDATQPDAQDHTGVCWQAG